MTRICVFCGSRSGRAAHVEAAQAFARTLAARGWDLVYGGGAVGLMGVVADAMLDAGREVIGVIPRALFKKEVAHRGVTELIEVASMHERKATMARLSDAFVALPGGLGTLDELFEALTWAQLGIHRKPVGMLDVGGYFGGLRAFLDRAVSEEFVDDASRALLVVRTESDALCDALAQKMTVPRP